MPTGEEQPAAWALEADRLSCVHGCRELHPDDCPRGIIDLVAACLSEHPEERPTAVQVFETIRTVMRRVGAGVAARRPCPWTS